MKEVLSHKKKIILLRTLLKKKDYDYYLLPRTDKFMNEFISEEDERVKWLTGFSGSFAFVIISSKQNLIFTDGRYINQIKKEVDKKTFKILKIQGLKKNLGLKMPQHKATGTASGSSKCHKKAHAGPSHVVESRY